MLRKKDGVINSKSKKQRLGWLRLKVEKILEKFETSIIPVKVQVIERTPTLNPIKKKNTSKAKISYCYALLFVNMYRSDSESFSLL